MSPQQDTNLHHGSDSLFRTIFHHTKPAFADMRLSAGIVETFAWYPEWLSTFTYASSFELTKCEAGWRYEGR